MPPHIEHCKRCFERYGETGSDLHTWMDEPVVLYGSSHRKERHDKNQEIPKFLKDRYGEELARNIMLDHLIADRTESRKIRQDKARKLDEAEQLSKIIPVQRQLPPPIEIKEQIQLEPIITPQVEPILTWKQILERLLVLDERLKALEASAI